MGVELPTKAETAKALRSVRSFAQAVWEPAAEGAGKGGHRVSQWAVGSGTNTGELDQDPWGGVCVRSGSTWVFPSSMSPRRPDLPVGDLGDRAREPEGRQPGATEARPGIPDLCRSTARRGRGLGQGFSALERAMVDLTPQDQDEVLRFAEFLSHKRAPGRRVHELDDGKQAGAHRGDEGARPPTGRRQGGYPVNVSKAIDAAGLSLIRRPLPPVRRLHRGERQPGRIGEREHHPGDSAAH